MATLDDLERDLFAENDPTTTAALRQRIIRTAEKYHVDPALMLSLAHLESRFTADATSPTGVQGLFQVTNKTGAPYGQTPQSRTNPDVSMETGIRHFRDLLRETQGDVYKALQRYGDPHKADYADEVLSRYTLHAGTVPRTKTIQLLMDDTAASLKLREQIPTSGRRPAGLTLDTLEQELFGAEQVPSPSPAPSQTPPGLQDAPVPPADITLDITKDTPERQMSRRERLAQMPGYGFMSYLPEAAQDAIVGAVDQWQPQWEQQVPTLEQQRKQLGAMGLQVGGSVAGALAGSAVGMPVLGGIVGGGLGTRAANLLGFQAPEQPIVETPVVNVYPSDVLGGLGDVGLPAVVAGVRGATRNLSRAGRALNAADQKTLQQLDDYRTAYQQRAADAETAYQAQRFTDLYDVAKGTARQQQAAQRAAQKSTDVAQEAFRREAVQDVREWAKGQSFLDEQAVAKAQEATVKADAAWESDVAKKTQQWADETWQAYTEWDAAEQRLRSSSVQDYDAAAREAKQRQQAFRSKLQAQEKDMKAHMAMVKRLQALPGEYMPKVPRRTVADVDRDLGFLDQGGTSADTVIQRLGAEDIFDAQAMLQTERAQLGQAPAPARPQARPEPAMGAVQPEGDPLLQFIRRQGGMSLTDADVGSDWYRAIGNRPAQTSGLLNKGGRSVQDMANDAFDANLIDSANTDELRQAIVDALQGRGSQARRGVMPEAPAFPPEVPAPRRGAGPRGRELRASDALYQRLDDLAGTSEVDLSPVLDAAVAAKAQFGEGMAALQDARVRKILTDLTADDVSVDGTMSQVVSNVRALTRAIRTTSNSDVKYYLSRVVDGFDDAVRESALRYPDTTGQSAPLWDEARAVWQQEHAVDEVANMLKPSPGGILQYKRNDRGELVLVANPTKLFNELQAALSGKGAKAKSFLGRGALPEAEAQRLLTEVKELARTPDMPLQRPDLPKPVPAEPAPPVSEPVPGAFPEIGLPPEPLAPAYTQLPMPPPREGLPSPTPMASVDVPRPPMRERPPVEPYVEPPPVEPMPPPTGVRQALGELGGAYALGGLTGIPVLPLAVTYDIADRVFAWVMLHPQLRPLLRSMIKPGGEIDPAIVGYVAGLMRLMGEDISLPSSPERR